MSLKVRRNNPVITKSQNALMGIGLRSNSAFRITQLLWQSGHINYPTPDCCVDVLVFRGNHIALITRKDGKKACVGGFMEANDPLLEEMLIKYGDYGFEFNWQKELKEEANLFGVPCTIIGEASRPGRDIRLPSVPTVVIGGYTINPQDIKAGDDATDVNWVDFVDKNGNFSQELLEQKIHADHRGIFQKMYHWYLKNKNGSETIESVLRRKKNLKSPLSEKEIMQLAAKRGPGNSTFIRDSAINLLKKNGIHNVERIVDALIKAHVMRRWGQYSTAVDVIVIKSNEILIQASGLEERAKAGVLPGTFLRVGKRPESFNEAVYRCISYKYGLQIEPDSMGPIVRAASGPHGDPRVWRNAIAKTSFLTDQVVGESRFKYQWVNINSPTLMHLAYDHSQVIDTFLNWLKLRTPKQGKTIEQIVRYHLAR